jgi:hypothetical protein
VTWGSPLRLPTPDIVSFFGLTERRCTTRRDLAENPTTGLLDYASNRFRFGIVLPISPYNVEWWAIRGPASFGKNARFFNDGADMVRSTAIGWKVGLAVAVSALSLWQLPARAEDGPSEKVEAPRQPIEPKAVKVILLPPADDAVFALRRPEPSRGVSVISVESGSYGPVALPASEPADIREDAGSVEIPAPLERRSRASVPPASNIAVAQPRPEPAKTQADAAPVESLSTPARPPRAALVPPASNAVAVQQRQEPAKIQQDAASIESPSAPARSPRVALVPPASDTAVAPLRPEPAKTQKNATFVEIPSIPARSPFRQAARKGGPVENEWRSATSFQDQAPEPAPAKGNAAFRFLTNLWPGNKPASGPVSPATSSAPPQQNSAETEPAGGTPAAERKPARLLDALQFWKN